MSKMNEVTKKYNDVDARPVKSFFVSMLTRDISLTDAILDLLDNCVDGIHRNLKKSPTKKPYKGYYAEISFDKDTFCIHDNCGGIPLSLHEYAFRMGRPGGRKDQPSGTVGTYGIGMKRAIFKIGRDCVISSRSGKDEYEVRINSDWLNEEENWKIPVNGAKTSMKADGTTVVIGDLDVGVSSQFGHDKESFTSDFVRKVSTHYAIIIDKGFEVRVNGIVVSPKPIELLFAEGKKAIRPFIYKTKHDNVDIFLAVGFTRPLPTEAETNEELSEPKYSSEHSGWTVICNDRVVLYCDKTDLTGWGDAGVPMFHSQFNSISGILEFRSNEPHKLPTTTTKRGIDASSSLYLQSRQRMCQGTKIFTNFTNHWKSDIAGSKKHLKESKPLDFEEIKIRSRSEGLKFSSAKRGIGGSISTPDLPEPTPKNSTLRRISFSRDITEIGIIGEYLMNDRNAEPNRVGERCFDEILRRADK